MAIDLPRSVQAQQTTSCADFPPELAQVIKREAGNSLADHGSFFLDSFSDDAVLDFPFDPGGPFTVRGTKEIRDLFVKVERSIRIEHVVLTKSYKATDGKTLIIQYTSVPRLLKSNITFSQQYIAVIMLENGRITLFREYINPLKPLQAQGKYPLLP